MFGLVCVEVSYCILVLDFVWLGLDLLNGLWYVGFCCILGIWNFYVFSWYYFVWVWMVFFEFFWGLDEILWEVEFVDLKMLIFVIIVNMFFVYFFGNILLVN